MKFYDLKVISKKGRIDLSPYFNPEDKVVFSYDSESDWYEIEPVIEGIPAIGQVRMVDAKGKIDLPWWMLEDAEGFMVSLEKDGSSKIRKMILVPVGGLADLIEKRVDKKGKVSKPPSASKEKVNYISLSPDDKLVEHMLKSAFGGDFDVDASAESGL